MKTRLLVGFHQRQATFQATRTPLSPIPVKKNKNISRKKKEKKRKEKKRREERKEKKEKMKEKKKERRKKEKKEKGKEKDGLDTKPAEGEKIISGFFVGQSFRNFWSHF